MSEAIQCAAHQMTTLELRCALYVCEVSTGKSSQKSIQQLFSIVSAVSS